MVTNEQEKYLLNIISRGILHALQYNEISIAMPTIVPISPNYTSNRSNPFK
jgi:hypothetical protein